MTQKTTSVSGGECLAGAYDSSIGSSDKVTMTFTESGSSITAISTAQSNGISCNWTGTADTDRFALNLSTCQSAVNAIGVKCSNGSTRDVKIASSGMNMVIDANGTYSGTKADTYNVFNSGTSTQVGTLTFSYTVSMTK